MDLKPKASWSEQLLALSDERSDLVRARRNFLATARRGPKPSRARISPFAVLGSLAAAATFALWHRGPLTSALPAPPDPASALVPALARAVELAPAAAAPSGSVAAIASAALARAPTPPTPGVRVLSGVLPSVSAIPEAPSLRDEVTATRAIRAAMPGSPARALLLLADARRRFPRGALAEERQALEVLALAGAGRAQQAQLGAAAYLELYPHGAFRSRMRSITSPAH